MRETKPIIPDRAFEWLIAIIYLASIANGVYLFIHLSGGVPGTEARQSP